VLVADDYAPLRAALARMLAARGHEVAQAADAAALVAEAGRFSPQLVVSDIEMSGDGLRTCRLLRDGGFGARFVLMSGSEARAVEAERAGFSPVLRKPFDLERLAALAAS